MHPRFYQVVMAPKNTHRHEFLETEYETLDFLFEIHRIGHGHAVCLS